MNSRRLRRAGFAVVAAAALAVTGCSAGVSIGGKSLSQETLQNKLADEIAKKAPQKPDVACDGELKGEVGATQKCQVTIADTELPYTVTVTKVDGDQIYFDYKPDETSTTQTPATEDSGLSVAQADLEGTVAQRISADPQEPVAVQCAGPLAGQVGATQTCTATDSSGERRELTVTVTSVVGTTVNFDIR